MNNQLAFKNLSKIRNIAIALFFIELLSVVGLIIYSAVTATLIASGTIILPDPSAPSTIPTLNSTLISSTIFSVFAILMGTVSMVLTIVNLVFACQTKINNETITIIIVFAALGFVLFVVSPIVLWVLSSKYKKIAEDEMIKENKATKAEAAQVQI